MGMLLTPDTSNVIRAARPIVAAINALFESYQVAGDILIEETEGEFDDHEIDPIRDLANEHCEHLFRELNALIEGRGIEVKFNRVDGSYILVEKA